MDTQSHQKQTLSPDVQREIPVDNEFPLLYIGHLNTSPQQAADGHQLDNNGEARPLMLAADCYSQHTTVLLA